jgi:predicted N-acetyltransferase YhbS
MVTIGLVQGDELARIEEFYKQAGYRGGVSKADITLAAKVDGRLAGVVRLCDEAGVIVLRGMHVAPAFQRQGIGRSLLAHCVAHLDRGVAYCLPYDHLVAFYGHVGFVEARAEALPSFLGERLAGYLSSGQRVLAMRRAPPGSAGAP